MFIETYYDERLLVTAESGTPAIPYPELSGEELRVWQEYLPVKRDIKKIRWLFESNVPGQVFEELAKARKMAHLFDRIEIWSRVADPIAVGVVGGTTPRYFSIVRWGDGKLTLDQVKRRLWWQAVLFWCIPVGGILACLAAVFAIAAGG